MHQHDLHEDALVAEVTQTLDVVAHVAAQPLGPALLGYLVKVFTSSYKTFLIVCFWLRKQPNKL